MGSLSAQAMAEHAGVNETTMTWHLRSNHFPPHPHFMVPVAMAAVDALNEGDNDREIELPKDVEFKGRTKIAAWEIAESLHLWDFVDVEVEL